MCEGEFESLKAIHAVSPGFVPKPYAWGRYAQADPETYFVLEEFRDIGKQVRGWFPASSPYDYTLPYLNRLLSTQNLPLLIEAQHLTRGTLFDLFRLQSALFGHMAIPRG